jgi:Tetratricopeptide repeat
MPPPGDERTTERRLLPGTPHVSATAAESTRETEQEDFLFHLYRGSELLQENRVLEAKEELEYALTMQPSDPKGQDLLGAVYFRLGHYPRAIQIYESLEMGYPNDASIKVNLALAYLKTGQPEPARRALLDATRLHPEHKRAWGYLGLALQKLGELEQAQIAFERGGHQMMAKRVTERRQTTTAAPPAQGSSSVDAGVRSVAETAFSELDAGELRFALAEPGPAKTPDGPWHTVEPGNSARPGPRTSPPPPSVHETRTLPPMPAVSPAAVSTRLIPPPPEAPAPQIGSEPAALPALFPAGDAPGVVRVSATAVLVRATDDRPFAARLDALRVVSGAVTTRVLHRRARDVDGSDVLGGIGSPVVRVAGSAQLVLGSRAGHKPHPLALRDGLAFVREEALLGFELSLAYENGRLALEAPGEGARNATDGAHIVQLRGTGTALLELSGALAGVPCTPNQPLLVRREWVAGWLGRLVTRPLPATESPSGQRGLIAFSGEGTVLVYVA